MRIVLSLLTSLILTVPANRLGAQETVSVSTQILQAQRLRSQGQQKAAIAILESVVHSNEPGIDRGEIGIAWQLLGSSYQDLEVFDQASRCDEAAIQILRTIPSRQAEYAAALDDLASVENAVGDQGSARVLNEKAMHIYEGLDNHSGVAVTSTDLALTAFAQKDFRASRRYLARAEDESRLAPLRDDDLASIESVKGLLDEHERQYTQAIADFQKAIDILSHAHGQDHFLLAAAYTLHAAAVAKTGDYAAAISDEQRALAVLDVTVGKGTPPYLRAEIAYARILRDSGAKEQASRMEKEAVTALTNLQHGQCRGCTISVESFR